MSAPLTTPTDTATITTNHPPATQPCGLNSPRVGRAKSDTPHYDANGVRVEAEGHPQLYDTTRGLPTLVNDGAGTQTIHGAGGILTQDVGTSTTYPVADSLGSIRGQTNNTGNLTSTANHDTYGAPRGAPIPGGFGYTGEQTDTTGLVNLRARMYDPASGRFQQTDSVQPNGSTTQGWSLYGYTSGNPTTATDPTGHFQEYSSTTSPLLASRAALAGDVVYSSAPTLGYSSVALKTIGIGSFSYITLKTMAECLSAIAISSDAQFTSATSALPGFLCAPTSVTVPATGPDPDVGDEEEPKPPVDPPLDSQSPCQTSAARISNALNASVSNNYNTLHSDPFYAGTRLTPPQKGRVQTDPWLTRPFFGTLMHNAVASDMTALLAYYPTGPWDFQDRADPMCWYELTTTKGEDGHRSRGGVPGGTLVEIVTYPSLDGSWRFKF